MVLESCGGHCALFVDVEEVHTVTQAHGVLVLVSAVLALY
jgi:hypothetical protein